MSFEKPYYFVAMVFSPLWEGPKWLEVALDANFASVRLDADQSKRFELAQMQLSIATDEQKTWYLAWRDEQGKWAIGIHDTALQKQLHRAPPPALAAQLAALKGTISTSPSDDNKKKALSGIKLSLPNLSSVAFGKLFFVVFVFGVLLISFREKLIKGFTQSLIPIDMNQEVKMGEDLYKELYPKLKVIQNSYIQNVLDTSTARLALGSTYAYAWVVVQDENSIDIDALPSGIMLVPTGLLRRIDSVDALYGVMLSRIQMVEQRFVIQELVAAAGWSAFWSLYRQDYPSAIKKLAPYVRGLNYSQRSYYAADRPVFIRLWTMNVDPQKWMGFLEKQLAWQKRDGLLNRTVYPITKERITYIKDIDSRKPHGTAYFPVASVDWLEVRKRLPSIDGGRGQTQKVLRDSAVPKVN